VPSLAGLLLAATALAGGPALASSPQAWSAYDRQVRTACVAASGLAAVRVKGQRVDLPGLGLSALLLEGTYPQPHMGGRKGLELCLVEQRSGRASVAEADRLIGPAATPLPGQGSGLPAPAPPRSAEGPPAQRHPEPRHPRAGRFDAPLNAAGPGFRPCGR
jgi:hypothetical protein